MNLTLHAARARLTDEQRRVLDALEWGHLAAKKAKSLEAEAGLEDQDPTAARTRAVLLDLILEGYPVVSDTSGYWLTDDASEIQQYMESLEQRNRGVFKRLGALKRIRNYVLTHDTQQDPPYALPARHRRKELGLFSEAELDRGRRP